MKAFLILVLLLGAVAAGWADDKHPLASAFYADPKALSGQTFKVKCDYIERRVPLEGERPNPAHATYWAHLVDSSGRGDDFIIVKVKSSKAREFERKYKLMSGSELFKIGQARSLTGSFSAGSPYPYLFCYL